ncbi:MAG TPA: ASKHA domain-containing protein [Rhizomicrobium sp.]
MTKPTCELALSPAGRRLKVAAGMALRDVLFEQGVEFPCGGHGRCKGCRVRLLKGHLEPGAEEARVLTQAELADGWRLACRHFIAGDLELELAQWEMPILSDHSAFAFTPRAGLGAAVDLGTTTIAAQLLDLATGNVLAARTALNAQARHGGDVISRVEYALRGGQGELERLVREQIGRMIGQLLDSTPPEQELVRIVLVGNTVMHHLFCGLDVTPLATHPFEPEHPGRIRFSTAQLGWGGNTAVEFMPCIGGLVGSDILAGIVATGLGQRDGLGALIDLGTNGEVVVGGRDRLVCTSTAAGPAFEGARIAMGMRAATGAISEVRAIDGAIVCRIIGGGAARGLCGSGLVDAVAAGLNLGWIEAGGRMTLGSMPLSGPVALIPQDVRELQLAKGAIAAGLRMLAARLGVAPGEIGQLHLAGAFGNTVGRVSARRIGLLRLPVERIVPAGNAALLGAKRALFEDPVLWDGLAKRIEHVALNEEPAFQDIFAEEMRFPERA